MKAQEMKDYTRWLAENYRVYRADLNLWETNSGTEIVIGDLLPRYYSQDRKKKRRGVFGFLGKLLPILILSTFPIQQPKATVRDTTPNRDSIEVKPISVWVVRKLVIKKPKIKTCE